MAARKKEDHRNEVVLVGRLSAPVEERTLPSGDVIATWRLIVNRPPEALAARRATVDVLDCASFRREVRRAAARWVAGDLVEVTGALRRRFWRAAGQAASRWQVDVQHCRRRAPATRLPVGEGAQQ